MHENLNSFRAKFGQNVKYLPLEILNYMYFVHMYSYSNTAHLELL